MIELCISSGSLYCQITIDHRTEVSENPLVNDVSDPNISSHDVMPTADL